MMRRTAIKTTQVCSQRDVDRLMAPLVSSSIDGSTPDSETFLEQVTIFRNVFSSVYAYTVWFINSLDASVKFTSDVGK